MPSSPKFQPHYRVWFRLWPYMINTISHVDRPSREHLNRPWAVHTGHTNVQDDPISGEFLDLMNSVPCLYLSDNISDRLAFFILTGLTLIKQPIQFSKDSFTDHISPRARLLLMLGDHTETSLSVHSLRQVSLH